MHSMTVARKSIRTPSSELYNNPTYAKGLELSARNLIALIVLQTRTPGVIFDIYPLRSLVNLDHEVAYPGQQRQSCRASSEIVHTVVALLIHPWASYFVTQHPNCASSESNVRTENKRKIVLTVAYKLHLILTGRTAAHPSLTVPRAGTRRG